MFVITPNMMNGSKEELNLERDLDHIPDKEKTNFIDPIFTCIFKDSGFLIDLILQK